MLVKNFSEMKAFLPSIEMKGNPTVFNDALEVAQNDLTDKIIGEDLELLLEARNQEDARLLKMCQRIISVDAFLTSIPEMDLVLTDAGFAVMNNESMAPASRERVQSLTAALQARLDDSKDKLISFLMGSERYNSWNGTEQYNRLADGLIMTFTEFKDCAVMNRMTAQAYPKTWEDFLQLNPALNVALMTDVAGYISTEYAEEILEKTKDREPFLAIERQVIKLIKIAIATIVIGDKHCGIEQVIAAVAIMKANPDSFPTFSNSTAAEDMTLTHDDSPIFSMF